LNIRDFQVGKTHFKVRCDTYMSLITLIETIRVVAQGGLIEASNLKAKSQLFCREGFDDLRGHYRTTKNSAFENQIMNLVILDLY
jgi:hypothetical protein